MQSVQRWTDKARKEASDGAISLDKASLDQGERKEKRSF